MSAATVSTRPPVPRLAAQPRVRGRDELLHRLALTLVGPGDLGPAERTRVHVLHGVGGCGKSTVALALAGECVARGIRTWWICAADAEQTNAGLRAVAVELGARPGRLRLGSAPDQLWRLLDQLPEPWLLVIDEADDPLRTLALPGHRVFDGTGWLRPIIGRHGTIVVTSRDGSPATWGPEESRWLALHPVRPLSSQIGALVLRELAGEAGSFESARRLSEQLGGLPLALRVAGRFLGETARIPAGIADSAEPRTFDSYAQQLRRGRHRELFGADLDGDHPTVEHTAREAIGPTWELSLDLLDANGVPEARPMLRLLSCLGPSAIPYALLLRAPTLAQSPMFPGITGRRMWTVLRALASVGLADLNWDGAAEPMAGHTLVLPPLVRQSSRGHREVGRALPRYLTTVTALLMEAVADLDPHDPASWSRWRTLAEHCGSPLNLVQEHRMRPADTPPDVLAPAVHAARYLRAAGHLTRAANQYTTLISVGRRLLGSTHPEVVALHHDLSRVWYDAGQYDRAKRGLHAVLEVRRTVLGPDHPDTLTTAHCLARALREHGQHTHAYTAFTELLDRRRQVLGTGHLDTMTTASQLADMLRGWGRLDQAEAVFREVYAARRARLGADHPATLASRVQLAKLAGDRGDTATAEAQLRDLHTAFQASVGADHPWTLRTQQALADVCHRLGRLGDAECLVREALHARHRLLGYDHPATLTSRHRLGAILQDQGDLDGADKELLSVLEARRRVLCARHPDTSATAARLDGLRRARRGTERPPDRQRPALGR